QKNEELTLAYQTLNLKADSLQLELNFALQQLQDKINENLAQIDLKDDLRKQLEAKKSALSTAYRRIRRLIAQGGNGSSSGGSSKSLLAAKNEITVLKQKNTEYIAKVERAQKEYVLAKNLADQNGSLASKFMDKSDSLHSINTVLETKLAGASVLSIAGLSIQPIRERKGKQEIIEKANKVERIKLNFSVLASELTTKEKKELTIRIIEPSGAVLTEDTDKLTDSDELYSLLESLTYDGTEKGVTFYYDQEAAYKKGKHRVEIYHDDKLLDRGSFSLR
ncbi:hypothetical protein N9I68_04630, partial [Bacteroidia bacterium]|nr:hypothetical protein [Bacteroidia bacterium]